MYCESGKHGLEKGLCKPTIAIWQGGTFLLYDSIEGALYNEDGTEYKPLKSAIKTAPKPVSSPKTKQQQSLFDLFDISAPKMEAENAETSEPELDESDDEIDSSEPDELDDSESTDVEGVGEAEQDDEPKISKGLHQISETKWTDDDGVVYVAEKVAKPAVPDALIKLFGTTIIVR